MTIASLAMYPFTHLRFSPGTPVGRRPLAAVVSMRPP